MRSLEREIASVFRKVARDVVKAAAHGQVSAPFIVDRKRS